MTLSTILSPIKSDLLAVNEVIRASLHSEVPLVNQVAGHIIQGGGKRLRPSTLLLVGGLFGSVRKEHHELAAVIEFIHTATLLHDDVVDQSTKRRNHKTANTIFGNAASVLVGDFIYSRAFQMMVKINHMKVMEVLANTTNTIAEGEVLQLLNIHNASIEDEDYLKVVYYKTAKLFESAAELGAIIGGADDNDIKVLAQFGKHMGIAFQLIDDVLDLSGNPEEIGKNLGDDLAEGKPTLPLLYAMKKGSDEQKNIIRAAIENGGLTELESVLNAVKETKALEYVRELAKEEIEKGEKLIQHITSSVYKDALLALTQFVTTRDY
ncbi:polyprenyl synthetase family protein [Candidatus Methylopumilus rimovensis]|uniref:polyprenyl synthetase family protein n=1 Tax=Candidatus Methylopumilus rimovensis TaxID=2588535 RepID=UPI001123A1D7|nr:polyprenyl synthetase family protein [Candidatus Methylopumilus rimovensis]QDD12534.1 octaprenyl diphosphate synthase [Candidatus Methylopumilus rimovensis]